MRTRLYKDNAVHSSSLVGGSTQVYHHESWKSSYHISWWVRRYIQLKNIVKTLEILFIKKEITLKCDRGYDRPANKYVWKVSKVNFKGLSDSVAIIKTKSNESLTLTDFNILNVILNVIFMTWIDTASLKV